MTNIRLYVAAAALTAVACASAGVRPMFQPLPNAVTAEVSATAAQIIPAIEGELLKERGLQIQWVSTADGYLETQWYNVQTRSSANMSTGALDQQVLFRFWVDPVAEGKSKVTGEAVWMRGWDPSRDQREQESMVPEAHPGGQILSRIMSLLRQEYGG